MMLQGVPEPAGGEWENPVQLSALNHFVYCGRRCALIHIEGVFVENQYTIEGSALHEEADTPGFEARKGVRVVRALPLYSRRLEIVGKADIVEFQREREGERAYPIDYKRGKRVRWSNDDVQLCAQALCLEEMLGTPVVAGAIFHATSKRRRAVEFTSGLRSLTEETISRVVRMIREGRIPRAELKPQCEGCSLHEHCLPEFVSVSPHSIFAVEGDL